ncbi:DNA-formamidopyrimidine glycosylase [Psittacicella hinzii]|uniref:DNA-formamidopyrimidine glycosylase n=1 Tax=Psittacicella hinzii TaxID=2028575 RepID=A0A3A1Y4U7_9GAMM|nr:bifunctional DNA-formamidopyrimidine glycosylase/DNA-(apurinic or apyrimidinic site) lyase [Psittacicella hinzii]RIY32410.1 DNA-formamidopyrimidine glycosylase [Psittacicella hinzii]
MPELPEVETTVRGISPLVLGRKIVQIVINNDKCRLVPGKELLEQVGTSVLKVFRRAKYVCIDNGKGYIVIHLGMSGNLKVVSQDLETLKHDHVLIKFDNNTELRYNDHRRFGGVTFIAKDDFDNNKLFAHNGPDALSEEFNRDYLVHFLKKKTLRPIKLFLMDNKVVVGVGNIYANESLYECGINPCTYVADLSEEQMFALVDSIKRILHKSIQAGGTTLKDFEQPDGKPGYFAQSLQCYGKEGEYNQEYNDYFCKIELGGRSSFFLPKKQPLIGRAIDKYSELVEQAQKAK